LGGGKNIEITETTQKDGLRNLEEAEIDKYATEIEDEKLPPRL
jgi:20S proteasome subunit alpha 4